jgi:hypothetical protein
MHTCWQYKILEFVSKMPNDEGFWTTWTSTAAPEELDEAVVVEGELNKYGVQDNGRIFIATLKRPLNATN